MASQSALPPPYSVAVTPMQVQQTTSTAINQTTAWQVDSKYLMKIWRTAVVHIVGGGLLVCLGIVAIILLGFWSYFATPIWTGLVIFVLTGCFGLKSASSGNKCWIATYITMSVFAALTSGALVIMYSFAAMFEDEWWWYDSHEYYYCQPGNEGTVIFNCAKSEAARQTFDALIAVTGFALFILSIVSASYGCCAKCDCSRGCQSCCKSCCQDECCSGCSTCCMPVPKPTTAVFMANSGPGTAVAPAGRPGMYLVQQNPTVAFMPQAGAMAGQLHQPTVSFTATQQLQQPVAFQEQQYQPQQQYQGPQQQQQSLQQQQQYPQQLQHLSPMQQQQLPPLQQQQQQQLQAAVYQQEKEPSELAQGPPSYVAMPPPQ